MSNEMTGGYFENTEKRVWGKEKSRGAERETARDYKENLSAAEKKDIDHAIAEIQRAHADKTGWLNTSEADGIIISYGDRALPYLLAQVTAGQLSLDDYRYFDDRSRENSYYNKKESTRMAAEPYEYQDLGYQDYGGVVNNMDDMGFLVELIKKLDQLKRERGSKTGAERTFFPDKGARNEIFKFCAAIAEYLRSQKIPNLVIIDRSARPLYVGVREYLRTKYPNETMPNMYFMNPKGFKAREDLTPREIDEIIAECEWKGDATDARSSVRTKGQIYAEFQGAYKALLKDKDKPVLIFDTCLHTGKSLEPVKNMLKLQGFTDIRIGAVNPSDRGSKVQTDFNITNKPPERGCYPFDKDRLVEKTFDHVYSKRTNDAVKRSAARQLREEIKTIMQERLGHPSN